VRRPHISAVTTLNLTDNDRADLARFLVDRYPLSPHAGRFKALLEKIDPPPAPTVVPFPKPPGERSAVLAKKRQR
jgi:hypothetical protein